MNSNLYEPQYKNLLREVLINGQNQKVREGATSLAFPGLSIEFQSKFNEFPFLTSKEMYFKNVKYELYWILSGSTNVKYLQENKVSIWNLWADKDGDIGETYGRVLRSFNGVDQLKKALNMLESTELAQSRRNVVSLWNPTLIEAGNIAPCYPMFQFVRIARTINIIVTVRSSDLFIGLPYDMAVFYLLLRLISDKYDLIPGKVRMNIGNAHIYVEHIDAVKEYIFRKEHYLPTLVNEQREVTGFSPGALRLVNYKPEPFIKAKIII